MSMEYVKCPHCGHPNGPVSVNPNASYHLTSTYCRSCHEPYKWAIKNGRIQVFKS